MTKLKMESMDMTQHNIDRIAEMFPQVVTEVVDPSGAKDAEGKPLLKKAVDFEKLKLVLSAGTGDYVVADDERERYEFTWVGKRQAMIDAATPIRKTLRPCVEESVNFDTTENIYIEGDNLEVLKLLQESYLGKVKMIYIDPPYNTGKDFVYKDNFKQSAEEYNEESGMYDEEDNKLFQNTETNGRFHSDWCSMIYPRLQLAHNLLTDDGVIFISIDDNEVENLKKICDEVFGASNFVAQFVWVKKKKGSHLSKTTRSMTEYVICYARKIDEIELYGEDAYSDKQQPLAKRTNAHKELTFPAMTINTTLKDGHYNAGTYGEGTSSLTFSSFDVINGVIENQCSVTGPFVWGQPKLDEEIILGTEINLSSKFGFNVLRSNQGEKIKRPSTLIDQTLKVGTNEDAYNEALDIFKKEGIMSYPKPTTLVKYLINSRSYFDKNSIVLDFFSGSATTAHAVMQLNAEDGGNRKFIMVQLPEETDEKSEARKAGYKNICEIGKERIRRAGAKIVGESKGTDLFSTEENKLDIGFRVFKTDTTNMKDVYYSAGAISQATLFGMESNIKEDRTDIDLLYGALLDWGVELTYPHTAEQIDGYTVHTVDTPATDEIDIIACFDKNISETAIREIASRKPLRALFRDHSFADSANKINVYEIFKAVAPDTSVKVM